MGECQWQTVWAGWEYSCMNGRFLFLKPASRWDSLFSSDLKLISIKTKVYFQMALLTFTELNMVHLMPDAFALLVIFIGSILAWDSKASEPHLQRWNQCKEVPRPTADPRPFQPSFNSSIIPPFFQMRLPSLILSVSLLPPLPDSFLAPLTPKC